ncbi:ferrous iron transporter B [bacterium]|nr:ferrous iron transporter B [bacterium]
MSASTNPLTRPRWIACIGYPNAGKTSVFNYLTHSHFKAVNYPGSTVQYNLASTATPFKIQWIDTPGVVTFSPDSDDEKITYDALTRLNQLAADAPQFPDLILYVADAFQLQRHLMGFKVLQMQGYPIALIVTRADLLTKYGGKLNVDALSQLAGVPVFFGNSHSGNGLPTIKELATLIPETPYTPTSTANSDTWKNAAIWAGKTAREVISPPQIKNELDRWLLHPILGGFFFLGIMTLFFFLIFLGAQPLMAGIESGWGLLTNTLHRVLPDTVLTTWLIDGLFTNIGAVLVFLPQIFLLFFASGILESSGYLARAAVIVDRPLSWLGLSGKSFVPILSGSACAIPAILATRNIPHRFQRMITLWMIPLMPCSARIPVYGLLVTLLFDGRPIPSALGMVAIYIISIVIAIFIGKLASYKWKTSHNSFYMELPRWQRPHWPTIFRNTIRQSVQFLQKAGPAIIAISVVLWGLSQYPTPDTSWLAHIGRFIGPVFAPLGWDWRVGVAVLASFAAREVFVTVLAAMLAIGENQLTGSVGISQSLLSVPSILALIIFFMVSMQCGTTLVVLKKELGSWKIPVVMAVAYIGLAYLLAVLVFNGASLIF